MMYDLNSDSDEEEVEGEEVVVEVEVEDEVVEDEVAVGDEEDPIEQEEHGDGEAAAAAEEEDSDKTESDSGEGLGEPGQGDNGDEGGEAVEDEEVLIAGLVTPEFEACLTMEGEAVEDGSPQPPPWLQHDLLASLKMYAAGRPNHEITKGGDFARGLVNIHACQGGLLLALAIGILPPDDKSWIRTEIQRENPDFGRIFTDELETKLLLLLNEHIFADPGGTSASGAARAGQAKRESGRGPSGSGESDF